MTIEQKAEEYKESKRHKCFREDVGTIQIDYEKYLDNLKQAYIAGATENGIQWHNLRKDPNDVPKGHRVVLNQVGMATTYDPNRGFLGFEGCGITAWCEIPQFKE